jgi:hypothetical protein
VNGSGTQPYPAAGLALGLHAHALQQRQGGFDVPQFRDVVEDECVGRQQAGAQDGQRGVLGTRDHDLAVERDTALDAQFIHSIAQRAVDRLVAGERALPLEDAADDQGLEVGAVAVDFEVLAFEIVGDVLADEFGGGRHGQLRSL